MVGRRPPGAPRHLYGEYPNHLRASLHHPAAKRIHWQPDSKLPERVTPWNAVAACQRRRRFPYERWPTEPVALPSHANLGQPVPNPRARPRQPFDSNFQASMVLLPIILPVSSFHRSTDPNQTLSCCQYRNPEPHLFGGHSPSGTGQPAADVAFLRALPE